MVRISSARTMLLNHMIILFECIPPDVVKAVGLSLFKSFYLLNEHIDIVECHVNLVMG
jgi:hypothetical protein